MPVIQASTIGGAIIEGARWHVGSLASVHIGHTICVGLKTSDKNLVSHVRSHARPECSVDASAEGVSIIVSLVVKEIRHMIGEGELESMCSVVPASRFAEQVVLFATAPQMCGDRFVQAVRKTT